MADKTIVETHEEVTPRPQPKPEDTLKPHEVREIRDHLRHLHDEHNHDHPNPEHDHHHVKLPEWLRNPLSFIGMVALGTLLGMILFTLAFALSSKTANYGNYGKAMPNTVYVR